MSPGPRQDPKTPNQEPGRRFELLSLDYKVTLWVVSSGVRCIVPNAMLAWTAAPRSFRKANSGPASSILKHVGKEGSEHAARSAACADVDGSMVRADSTWGRKSGFAPGRPWGCAGGRRVGGERLTGFVLPDEHRHAGNGDAQAPCEAVVVGLFARHGAVAAIGGRRIRALTGHTLAGLPVRGPTGRKVR